MDSKNIHVRKGSVACQLGIIVLCLIMCFQFLKYFEYISSSFFQLPSIPSMQMGGQPARRSCPLDFPSTLSTITDKRQEWAHMLLERVDKMWWYPPEPPFLITSRPSVHHNFGHRLFKWMLHKLWHVRLTCPHYSCKDKTLTSAGVYNKLRTVVDVSSTYIPSGIRIPALFRLYRPATGRSLHGAGI